MRTVETVSIVDGDTFVVSDRRGDVDALPDDPHGLFHQDTRYLSRWRLTIGGRAPRVISVDEVESFAARFLLVQPHGAGEDSAFSVSRRRAVGDGFHEDVTVTNHTPNPLDLELYVEAAADFAQVELNGTSPKRGGQYQVVEPDRLVLGYSRAGFVRETWITTTAPDAVVTEDGLRFVLRLEPHGEWTTCLEVLTAVHALGNAPSRVKHRHANWR